MINIFLFMLCLVHSHIVDGIQDTLQEDSDGEIVSFNVAGSILQPEPGTSFYGVSGIVSVYSLPSIKKGQMTLTAISVINRSPNNYNAIAVGWHVSPTLYKDYKTHIFATWSGYNSKRGCTNLQCEGFVQTNKSVTLGEPFKQTSVVGGQTVYLALAILQNPDTKDWSIIINGKEIGYYPIQLFSNMTYVDQVAWYGKTGNPFNSPSPPMGSGLRPDGDLTHACHFKDLAFVDNSRKQQILTKNMGELKSTNRNCYDVAYYYNNQTGLSLQFGGTGGGKCD